MLIDVTYDEVTLDACILDISAKLPEQVEQPSYYIENGELIITSGKVGKAAQNDETKQIVADALNNKNYIHVNLFVLLNLFFQYYRLVR